MDLEWCEMKIQELFEGAPKQKCKHPFGGDKKTSTVTKQHRPLIWENMLGTVFASKFGDAKSKLQPKYFDFNWDNAREYAGVDKCDDLRISKNKTAYQSYDMPRVNQMVLWDSQNRLNYNRAV